MSDKHDGYLSDEHDRYIYQCASLGILLNFEEYAMDNGLDPQVVEDAYWKAMGY